MYPLFIIDDPDEEQKIGAMPGVSRMGINKALEHLDTLVPLGLSSVLIFSVSGIEKDDDGSGAVSDANPVYNAILKIKEKFGNQLLVAVDICICPYTSHGHCGVFNDKMEIDNERSIALLANMAGKFSIFEVLGLFCLCGCSIHTYFFQENALNQVLILSRHRI